MITSTANKRIKNVTLLLTKAKERKRQGLFVTEGRKMFLEAPEDWVREIYLSEEACLDEAAAAKLAALKERNGVLTENVRADIFCKMCDTKTPQGILCVLALPAYDRAELLSGHDRLANAAGSGKSAGLYLVLENIQDPGNLGTMFRAGEGAGITGIIMSADTVDVFNPKTVRATMGSIYRVPFFYADDLAAEVNAMKAAGVGTYAAHLKGSGDYDKEDYRKPCAFLIGNEGSGLSKELAELADACIKIPMLGKVESLNAAVAAALLLYETARQRRN